MKTRFDHFALGRLPVGVMNKTEQRYADFLELRKRAGEILWWKFEGIKLRLADKTFLTPDFAIMNADCSIQLDDIKGFMMDDANVKIKVAAEMYPFRFYIVRKGKTATKRRLSRATSLRPYRGSCALLSGGRRLNVLNSMEQVLLE
jgi:hypothetical protein